MVSSNAVCGTICAIEDGLNLFQRVRITGLVHYNHRGHPTAAIVYSLDLGWVKKVKLYQLYCLPECLQVPPPQAIDVHLCRLQPRDLDPNWSPAVNELVALWLSDAKFQENEGFFLSGKIMLSLCGSLWMDPLECKQRLTTTNMPVFHFSLRTRLLKHSLALENPRHLTRLYELSKEAGIQLPDYTAEVKVHKKTVLRKSDEKLQPQWAHLPASELIAVQVVAIVTPSSFFVQILKFQDLLDNLVDDICKHQNQQKYNAYKNTCFEPGSFILAKCDSNQTWFRARIESKQPNEEYLVFFVDFGDTGIVPLKHMLPMPEVFLNKLPFQAIECSLHGVCPANMQCWPESSSDLLSKVTSSSDSSMIPFALQVVGKVQSSVTGGWRYAVKLYDNSTHKEVGEQLIAAGEAQLLTTVETTENVDWGVVNALFSKDELHDNEEPSSDEEDTVLTQVPFYEAEPTLPPPNSSSVENQGQEDPYGFTGDECDFDEDDADSFDFESFPLLMNMIEELKIKGLVRPLTNGQDHSTSSDGLSEEVKTDNQNASMVRKNDQKEVQKGLDERNVTNAKKGVAEENACTSMCANNKSSSLALIQVAYEPQVEWRQNASWVVMKVLLIDVQQYNLTIEPFRIDFLTILEDRVYFFSKELFGYCDPQLSTHCNKGRHIEIKLAKLSYHAWPRLEYLQYPNVRTCMEVTGDDTSSNSDQDDDNFNQNSRKSVEITGVGSGQVPMDRSENPLHDISDQDCNDSSEETYDIPETFEVLDPYNPLPEDY